MECGDCCFLDCVFAVWATYLGRFFMVVLGIFMFKELTMGIYRKKTNMSGKVVVITGGNSGIGLETARGLAERGATVIIGCRSKERGDKAVKDIIRTTKNTNVEYMTVDLLSLQSVRQFAEDLERKVDKIDILVNNAGMFDNRNERNFTRSKDNLEITLQTNHLSHFLLTNLLKTQLAAAGNARVVNVSSQANVGGWIDLENLNYEKEDVKTSRLTYHKSKLMNIMFSKELAARWNDIGVTSYSLHPGFVRTNIFNDFPPFMWYAIFIVASILGKNNTQGAQTSLYLSCEPGIEHLTGEYFVGCRVSTGLIWLNKQAMDMDACSKLWEKSEQLVHLE